MLPSSVPGGLISTCITPWTFANSALLQPPRSSPHLCPSVRCLLQGWDGTPAASAVPHPVSAPAGFNIFWSTSQQIAQISVLFLSFFFLLILFKFDAVSVLVWYTLYKYMTMNIHFCCQGVFLHHHTHAHPASSRSLSVVFFLLLKS